MPAKMSNPKTPFRAHGIQWSEDMYLTSTSEIDGRRRWLEIVLLLASKLKTVDEDDSTAKLSALLLNNLESKDK